MQVLFPALHMSMDTHTTDKVPEFVTDVSM